jgi:hypothetical protein
MQLSRAEPTLLLQMQEMEVHPESVLTIELHGLWHCNEWVSEDGLYTFHAHSPRLGRRPLEG